MHELPIIARVLDLATASAPPGSEIVRIRLRVGYLCDAEPLWLERYFRISARGTQAELAELVVTREAGPTAADGTAVGAAGAKAGAPHGTAGTPTAAGAAGAKAGAPSGTAGSPPSAGASGPDRSAADAAFGYVLESIEVRDAPRRNGP